MPRFEGDQLVTTLGSNTIDATKGSRFRLPFVFKRDNETVQAGLCARSFHALFFLFIPMLFFATKPQATIIDTGSTNRAGLRVTIDTEGHATVEAPGGEVRRAQLPQDMCRQFLENVKASSPLNALPARHCFKSASFGSSLFVEFNGARSPDLSCPGQDEHAAALQKAAQEILASARNATGIRAERRIFQH